MTKLTKWKPQYRQPFDESFLGFREVFISQHAKNT